MGWSPIANASFYCSCPLIKNTFIVTSLHNDGPSLVLTKERVTWPCHKIRNEVIKDCCVGVMTVEISLHKYFHSPCSEIPRSNHKNRTKTEWRHRSTLDVSMACAVIVNVCRWCWRTSRWTDAAALRPLVTPREVVRSLDEDFALHFPTSHARDSPAIHNTTWLQAISIMSTTGAICHLGFVGCVFRRPMKNTWWSLFITVANLAKNGLVVLVISEL